MAPSKTNQEHSTGERERALRLYDKYALRYRKTSVELYQELLAEKKKLGICHRGDHISKKVLKNFPGDIHFLMIESRSEAKAYLQTLTEAEAKKLAKMIERKLEYGDSSYAYITVQGRIIDFKQAIRIHNSPKTPYGVNPDSIRAKKKGPSAKKED